MSVPAEARDHTWGPADAAVTLVEYGDFECWYCGAAYEILKQVRLRLPGKFRFVFRNFPLTDVHPRAELAAEAAEAVGAQGEYWGMHGWLFEHQRSLEMPQLVQAAADFGADVTRFRRDMGDHAFAGRVLEDFKTGQASGVTATPTFFINGIRHEGSYKPEHLIAAIEASERAIAGSPPVAGPSLSD